jgi:hypothetical protein
MEYLCDMSPIARRLLVWCRETSRNSWTEPGMVAHAFNPNTREAETGRFLSSRPAWSTKWVPGQPGKHCLKKKKKEWGIKVVGASPVHFSRLGCALHNRSEEDFPLKKSIYLWWTMGAGIMGFYMVSGIRTDHKQNMQCGYGPGSSPPLQLGSRTLAWLPAAS